MDLIILSIIQEYFVKIVEEKIQKDLNGFLEDLISEEIEKQIDK